MTIILHGVFGYPLGSLPTRSKEQWAEVLKLNATRINDKRILQIPDETNFSNKIADPSSGRYNAAITAMNPNPMKAKTDQMVRNNQRSNLLRSFTKYSTKLDAAFATVGQVVAKKFCDAVDVAAGLFADGSSARTMRAVGTRLEGVGAAVIVPYFLTNHPDAVSKVRPGVDIVDVGSPFCIVADRYQSMFIRLFTAELTFALIQANKSNLDTAILATLNDRLNNIAQSHLDPGKGLDPFSTGGLTHVNIINDPVHGEMVDLSLNVV